MRLPAISLLAVSALGCGLTAQDFIGFSLNGQISFTSRGFLGFGATAGEIMNRIDGNDYAGWGTDTPGFRTIRSIFFVVQDQNAVATPEVFDIKLYPESTTNPGFPDLGAGVIYATGVTGPAAPATGVVSAAAKTVTVAGGVAVPIQGGGDVFVSWVLPASPTASTADGLSIQALNGNLGGATAVMDVPGPTKFAQAPAAPSNTHGLTLTLPSTLTYSVAREWLFDVAHSGDGGAVLTITNQTTLAGSNNPPPTGFGPAPGTASFLSGTSPDVNGFNVGRLDDVAFDYFRTGFGTGSFVWLLLDNSLSAGFGPEIPIVTLPGSPPGSTGTTCLVDYSNTLFFPFATTTATTDEAFFVTLLPAFIRPFLAGVTLKWQAVGIDTAGFHASPCGAQRM